MLRARHRKIISFFGIATARIVWWDFILPRVGFQGLSARTRSARMRRIASAFRYLAVGMGGVLIKVGQFLSSRLDVLPREVTSELAGLQDEVAAEAIGEIRRVIEGEFGAPLEEMFASFSSEPTAAASIGQVHLARLAGATTEDERYPSIVVKVQRPNIEEIVKVDLAALRVVGRWLHRFKTVSRHVNLPALIEEFSRTLSEEIDYLHEGKNAERFNENFKNRANIRVPAVIWSHTTRRVLTLEDVSAIKITDYGAIEAAGIARKEVAARLVDAYLKQLFEDGFFHADPHPGNLFVQPASRTDRRGAFLLNFVDFGMAGVLPPDTFKGLREALIAVGTQDAVRLVGAYQKLGVLLPGADLELLERANRKVFERIWGRSTKDIVKMSGEELRGFGREFGDLLYEMPFQVPEHLILLGRCLAILSGMATGLDPDYSVWKSIAPYAERLIEADAGGGFRRLATGLTDIARFVTGLPKRTEALLTRAEEGRLDVRVPELKGHVVRLERAVRKLGASIVFAALLLAGTLLYLGNHTDLALAFGIVDAALLLWILSR